MVSISICRSLQIKSIDDPEVVVNGKTRKILDHQAVIEYDNWCNHITHSFSCKWGKDAMSRLLKLIIPGLIIIAGVLYFFVFTGVVKVDSSRPPGATVQIDGVVVGTTPLKQRVRAGVHQIRVSKGGFETWQGEEKVSGISVSAILVSLRFLLRSDPAGAEVVMDGKHIGETELAVDLKPGMYTFEFKKEGYRDAKFKAEIPAGASEPLPFVTLVAAEAPPPEDRWPGEEASPPEYGVIQVTSRPDAQVYLDGEWQGETPLTIPKVPVGSYVITLSREGYRELRRTVYVKKDETARFAGELKPEAPEQ
jgi:hypothetical protein